MAGFPGVAVNYCLDPVDLKTVDLTSGEIVFEPDQTLRSEVYMERLPDGIWRVEAYRSEFASC